MKRLYVLLSFLVLAFASLWQGTADAGQHCVLVVPLQGNESLLNTCDQCRMVQVTRARAGGGIQGKRQYAVPPRMKVDLNFNSPGKTRIFSDRPCGKERPSVPYKDARDGRNPQCVKLAMLKTGKPALINSCPACRQVELEYEIRNVGLKQETETVKARSVGILTPHPEAIDVRIRGDKNCLRR